MIETNCPTEDQLLALHQGELSEELIDTVADHLESCTKCSHRMNELEKKNNAPFLLAQKPTEPYTPGPDRIDDLPGYEIFERLGSGGMGIVHRALHRELGRIVAIKWLREGSRTDLERFRREAESSARLHHPSIVTVFEIGEHRGRPYLTMEFIAGGSLDARLKGRPQAPRMATQLVQQLAYAVQHAHDHGVVHRDIKPANVLLHGISSGTEIPSQGWTAKLTDFGIAKRLDGRTSRSTEAGIVLGTPSYMAPEQARGETVTPSADIYALGAVLYELITGRPPFQAGEAMETMLLVIQNDPVPPSRLVRIPRDLENICLKCLQKDPSRRYRTALELAEDLERYQSGRPVVARPISIWESSWKWASRNRGLTLGLVGAILALLIGTAMATWQAVRADNEARLAREAADELKKALKASEEAKEEAIQVMNFFRFDVLAQATPSYQIAHGFEPIENLTVRQALERAATRLDMNFKDQPRIKAMIHYTIGNAFRELRAPAKAIDHLRQAGELFAMTDGEEKPDTTLASLNNLAQAHQESGNPLEAIPIFKKLLESYTRLLGVEHEWVQLIATNLAIAELDAKQIDSALVRMESICASHRKARGPQHPKTKEVDQLFIQCLIGVREFPRAIEFQRQRVAETRESGSNDSLLSSELSLLGWLLLETDRLTQAESVLRECLTIREKTEPTLWTTDFSRAMLGASLMNQDQRESAEPLLLAGIIGLEKQHQSIPPSIRKLRLNQAFGWLIRFYERQNQNTQANQWRERLKSLTKSIDPR